MPNPLLKKAIAEAYASAPSDTIIYHTVEIRHPSFIDENGKPTSIRVVRDYKNLKATLESSHPTDAGKEVEFISYSFDIALPTVNDKGVPEVTLTIDNVSSDIISNLDRALQSMDPIKFTYRPYLSTDLSTPQYDPPLHLTLTDITADVFKVTGKARFHDLANMSFPNKLYTPSKFPALAR